MKLVGSKKFIPDQIDSG